MWWTQCLRGRSSLCVACCRCRTGPKTMLLAARSCNITGWRSLRLPSTWRAVQFTPTARGQFCRQLLFLLALFFCTAVCHHSHIHEHVSVLSSASSCFTCLMICDLFQNRWVSTLRSISRSNFLLLPCPACLSVSCVCSHHILCMHVFWPYICIRTWLVREHRLTQVQLN